jgi:DNA mismatch repair protein MutL
MVQKIHHLDSLTIDQIAAGEVIEAPSSCIKELVENSIDAGATTIIIEVMVGGRELIRVADNGCGMCRDDVIAAIERHATSKLRTINDLDCLSSLGFRGEALASIAAIARMTMTSAEKQAASPVVPATTLVVEGGCVHSVCDTSAEVGTSIEVRDLFYNVPARRKFLKSPARDAADVIKVVTWAALAAPQVGFCLLIDGKESLRVPEGQSFVDRAQSLLGEVLRHDAFEVKAENNSFSVMGLVAHPQHARTNRSGQYLIINHRPVTSLPISYAVKMAFGTTCEDRKHPQYALNLVLDPSCIDVNVHPQKREVRFSDEEGIRKFVSEAVAEAVFGKNVHTCVATYYHENFKEGTPFEAVYPDSRVLPFSICEGRDLFQEQVQEVPLPSPPSLCSTTESASPVCLAVLDDVALFQFSAIMPPLALWGGMQETDASHDSEKGYGSGMKERLMLLDLRRALRTVVLRELDVSAPSASTDMLLIPLPLECSVQEAPLISMALPEFEKLGFVIRSFGPHHFLVEGVPSYFRDGDIPRFILDVVHEDIVSSASQASREYHAALANAYVGTMHSMRHPISLQTALTVFERWANHGYPMVSPDGAPCGAFLTSQMVRQLIANGAERKKS